MDSDWLSKTLPNKDHQPNGKFAKGNKSGVKYAKGGTGQPQVPGEVKGAAIRRAWEYKRARSQLFESLSEIDLPGGGKVNFWDLCAQKIQRELFADEKEMRKKGERPLNKKDKINLIMRLIEEIMPKESNLNVKTNMPLQVVIEKDDADL